MKKIGGLGKGLDMIYLENESESSESTVILRLSDIEPNRSQPRTEFDEEALSNLAESIKENGVLQPILVRPLFGGGYQIVAGERRYRASMLAGLSEIPAMIRDLSDSKVYELALIENLQRENLSPIEEALGYKHLMDDYSMTQEQISTAVGKSRPAVANALRLLKLPDKVRSLVSDGRLSAGHARALTAIEDSGMIEKLAEEICEKGLSVRAVEKLATDSKKSQKKQSVSQSKPSFYTEVEIALSENLGRKVRVAKGSGSKGGTLTLEFYSDEELRELANRLGDKY